MLHRVLLFSLLVLGSTAVANEDISPSVTLKEARLTLGSQRIRVSLAVFSSVDFQIRVIDNAAKHDEPRFNTLAEAMAASDCVAGCNGGFFARQPFSPVGGMISDGQLVSEIDRERWMKGLLVIRSGEPALVSVDSVQSTSGISDLLQSGTWLVQEGKSETDTSRPQLARRTFICHDGKGTWAIGVSERCRLDELAALLRHPEITALIDIQFALNFDGGPSTGLWLKQSSETFYLPEKWPVRNYIGIFTRAK